MKIGAIVQARMGSKRLPNKVMKRICDIPMIEILLKRLSKSKELDKIIIVTSKNENNDTFVEHVESLGFPCERGSENNVLERFYLGAEKYNLDIVVRITGDCPLIDTEILDACVNGYKKKNVDYFSNVNPPTFPDGLDVEVFNFLALKKAYKTTKVKSDLEHVTPFIKKSKTFTIANLKHDKDLSMLRWTVDDQKDFNVIENIFKYFSPNIYFTWRDVLDLHKKNPNLFKENIKTIRNKGSEIGSGQKLYQRAKEIIPGGTMLLSKRPEMFLPNHWPSYFSKAKGCEVWDLDGNKFYDLSIMGIGTNTLGYGHEDVDEAVREVIKKGNMSTLNCPEEVELAEKLIEIHPWSQMVRFARTGGEANSIAIRIARAASGKEKIAFCGYHGWHDWYISANIHDSGSLDDHLLSGLSSRGVPPQLKNTAFPFQYNNLNSLKEILNKHDIGIIKMEVSRSYGPDKGFLESVRKIANEKNIILIFDECTSGFRETFGGLHKKYSVYPDLMMLGKTMGNGYAITAVLGTRNIMSYAEQTFISSTFWTERIGPTAALKTLEVMNQIKSWEKITKIGKEIGIRWVSLANKYDLPIQIGGLPSLINFQLHLDDWIKYKTLITQEMLKKGFLAANSIYVCIDHSSDIIDQYFYELDFVFKKISECEENKDIDDLLDGPISHTGFKRLN